MFLLVHVEANLQETSAPRATSGSDHQISALLGSIRGWILPPAPPPSLERLMPEGSAGERSGRWVGSGGACENCSLTCIHHIHHVITKAAVVRAVRAMNFRSLTSAKSLLI